MKPESSKFLVVQSVTAMRGKTYGSLNSPRARAFRSRCQLHRKRESQYSEPSFRLIERDHSLDIGVFAPGAALARKVGVLPWLLS